MLRQEMNSVSRRRDTYSPEMSIPIPMKSRDTQTRQNAVYEKLSQYGLNPFLPASSPPVSDFLKRLAERNMNYNNSANLSKLETA